MDHWKKQLKVFGVGAGEYGIKSEKRTRKSDPFSLAEDVPLLPFLFNLCMFYMNLKKKKIPGI